MAGKKFTNLLQRVLMTLFTVYRLGEGNEEFYADHYTDAHIALHRVVSETTHPHLAAFEIVVPVISSKHNIQRRDLRMREGISQPMTYSLSSRDHDFDIEIIPNQMNLLADDFFVQRIRHNDGKDIAIDEDLATFDLECYHQSRILSHENRTAAISTCGGLTGLLRTENDDFVLEPVPKHLPHDFRDDQQPHLLYKKKHLSKNNDSINICGKAGKNPIPISLVDVSDMKELSNGEIIMVKQQDRDGLNRLVSSGNPLRRPKRSDPKRQSRKTRILETLVVADSALLAKHGGIITDVTQYILTVMNMASALYKDPSLDEEVEIVIMGVMLLEDKKGLHLDHRADKSLSNFCSWQSKLNFTRGKRPDHSILITGTDICIDKNEPCDTLGLAQIGGMCWASESCTINEDNGLAMAFTIAHETGHSFGLKHDGQGNSCGKRDGHIMSSTLNTKSGVFSWSSCSRRAMANFFASDKSYCLEENQSFWSNVSLPEDMPGQIYNASIQCKLQYGNRSDVCHDNYAYNPAAICKVLSCYLNGVCRTKHMPAAEGTACGEGRWCRRGVCVSLDSSGPKPITGGWSKYGRWSECSRTCGKGISYKERSCTRPTPRYGGRYCEGEERIYRICNPQACPPGEPSYRAQQCAKFNSRPYRRQYFTWVPFTKYWKYGYNKCELFCEAEGVGFFDRLDSQVLDGSPCDEDTNDVCIEGHCVHVGCDLKINSNATEDACGVCNGDNSTCTFVNGSFKKQVFESGYYLLTKIPKGARTIRIWQDGCCTHTYIAARSAVNASDYFLNGDWRVNLYGEWRFGGSNWLYEQKNDQGEVLSTAGPIKEDLIIEVLIVRRNPGVRFTYALEQINNTLPHDLVKSKKSRWRYHWKKVYTVCSRTCGDGIQEMTANCVTGSGRVVTNRLCRSSERPPNKTVSCNVAACPPRWVTGNWSNCSRSCGGGIQVRRVSCMSNDDKSSVSLPPKQCISARPVKHRKCTNDECPPQWKTTRWSKCSQSCGGGVRTRTVYCRSGDKKIPYHSCDTATKPNSRHFCSLRRCNRKRYQWTVAQWGSCSATCGQGMQYRSVKCVSRETRSRRLRPAHHRFCKHSAKPTLHKLCSIPSCVTSLPPTTLLTAPAVQTKMPSVSTTTSLDRKQSIDKSSWVAYSWQQCTATCGGGRQVRAVRCMKEGRPSITCPYELKPPNTRHCNTMSCYDSSRRSGTVCEDKRTWCSTVLRYNTCHQSYFSSQCCRSCSQLRLAAASRVRY